MNFVGWLFFVFMDTSEKIPRIGNHVEHRHERRSVESDQVSCDVSVEELVVIREFFYLLAMWEETERRNEFGHKSGSRAS
jgi:hypothetical protein